MKIVNGWVQFDITEVCGAMHIWKVYENGMPCMCGQLTLDGLRQIPAHPLDRPNIAHRFGIMSHFIAGECGCHPPASRGATTPREGV